MSEATARQCLPLPRPVVTHKYKQGHLLVIAGSNRYAGGVILTALGARGSGVGMLSVAVPESLKPILVNHLPEALIIGCPETEGGAIAQLPPLAADFSNFDVIACGPGLTVEAKPVLEKVLTAQCPLVLDADGLNILAQLDTIPTLSQRSAPTVLTPHSGEFKRLFPEIEISHGDRISAAQIAAHQSGAIILFKGSRTVVAHRDGSVWLIPASTPALARGGTGDILTGLIGGLMGQKVGSQETLTEIVATAAWWHARAGILAARERTELGVDAFTLSQYLVSSLVK
jgi:NAD(P)H-hydrate epimerase